MNDATNEAYYRESADFILDKVGHKIEIGLILGSSLGYLSDGIRNRTEIDYSDIPNFLEATVESHQGTLITGDLCGKKVVCMSGRFHYYEGYDFEELVTPVRVLKLLGATSVILTNAAGAVNPTYKVGDIMLITDHIKLSGASPLRGHNESAFGPRFFDVSDMYTADLREVAKTCAKRHNIPLREGVYFYCGGPQFETPAEVRAIRILGGDAVGMSTVTEALTAAHCGMHVLGLSLVTNMAAGMTGQAVTGEEVDETAAAREGMLKTLIYDIVREMT